MQLKQRKKKSIFYKFSKKSVYRKMFGIMTKQGKKCKAKKSLNLSFFLLSFVLKKNFNILQKKIITELKIPIEVKRIVKRKVESFVPFKIEKRRKIYLTLKWFVDLIINDKLKASFSNKLFNEFKNTVETNSKSKFLNKKKEILESAIQNRSNIHFRW